ncbi:MAG: hypothetical protein AAGC95_13660 [Pseudomonadota bacterium]
MIALMLTILTGQHFFFVTMVALFVAGMTLHPIPYSKHEENQLVKQLAASINSKNRISPP